MKLNLLHYTVLPYSNQNTPGSTHWRTQFFIWSRKVTLLKENKINCFEYATSARQTTSTTVYLYGNRSRLKCIENRKEIKIVANGNDGSLLPFTHANSVATLCSVCMCVYV